MGSATGSGGRAAVGVLEDAPSASGCTAGGSDDWAAAVRPGRAAATDVSPLETAVRPHPASSASRSSSAAMRRMYRMENPPF